MVAFEDKIVTWAIAHGLLYLSAILLTLRPFITTFHIFLASQVIGFGLRPIFAHLKGNIGFYYVPNVEELYLSGMVIQFFFAAFFIAGYLTGVLAPRKRWGKSFAKHHVYSLCGCGTFGVMAFSLVLGLASVAAMHILSAGRWLAVSRSEAITAAVPAGKILFPLAVVSLSVALAHALLLVFLQRKFKEKSSSIVGILLTSTLLLVLYQRGFFISALMVSVALLERQRRIGIRWTFGLAVLVLLYVVYARPVVAWLFQGQPLAVSLEGLFYGLFLSPNFDTVDVWPVLLSYIEQNGFAYGDTLINAPFAILTPLQRLDLGYLTVVDLLNAYYWGQAYWDTRFGFNITLAQEFFLNFSWFGLAGAYLAGIATFLVDRFLLTRSIGLGFVAISLGAFNIYSGGYFVWPLAYFLYTFVVLRMAKGICGAYSNEKAPFPHHPR